MRAVLKSARWYLILVFIWIFLMISDAEHLFMYLLAIGRSLEKYLFSYSAILIFIFLLLSCMSFSYILGIDPLPGIYMACKYLLPLCRRTFHFDDGFLCIGFLFVVPLAYFCFGYHCFWFQVQRIIARTDAKKHIPYFSSRV